MRAGLQPEFPVVGLAGGVAEPALARPRAARASERPTGAAALVDWKRARVGALHCAAAHGRVSGNNVAGGERARGGACHVPTP
jgi:hypothetical protein